MISELLASGQVSKDWAEAFTPLENQFRNVYSFLEQEEAKGSPYLPVKENLLRAFKTPITSAKVLIVGQDPYPTPGHAVGLAFSVHRKVRPLPRSLQNIYRELQDDLYIQPATHGDLTSWSEQGVMLLNRVLSVSSGAAGSHTKKGWEEITEHAIKTLVNSNPQLVAILWGNQARQLKPLLGNCHIIASAHPSPLSARRGFFGSKPFSRTNSYLKSQKIAEIDWELPR